MTHVLVVDDELGIRETFQEFLEGEGYDVTVAADSFEAESFLVDHPCDVVVADIVLPGASGLSLLQRVREIDEDIPVIMITGDPDISTAAEAVRYGAYDYVAKPVTLRVLNRVVGRAAEKKHLLDEKRRLEAANQDYQADLEKRVAVRTAELEQRNRELAALIEIGHDISATLDLTKVLKRVTRRAAQVCGAYRCTILMLTQDGEMVIPTMSQFSIGEVEPGVWRLSKSARFPISVGQAPEVQHIIRERCPLFIPDVSALSLPVHLIEPFGIESVLIVPLIGKEQVIGLMALDHVEKGREFIAEQVNLATAIAAQAATAIENARLFEAEKRRVAQLKAISGVGKIISSILDLDTLLHRVVNLLVDVFGYYYVNVLMMDEEAREIVLTASAGQTGPAFEGYRLKIGEQGIAGWVAGSGEPLLINDVEREPRYHLVEELADTKSELAIPIKLQGKVIGVLDVQSNRLNAFDEMDLSTLTTLTDQMAIALNNARLLEETREHVARLEKTTRDLELLHKMSQTVSSSLDLTHILGMTVEQMVEVFEADHGGILLFDQAHTYGHVVAEYPPTGTTAERFPVQGYLAAERIIADREPLVIKDAWNDPLMATVREAMHRLDIRSMLIVPLIVKEEVVGSIGLDAVGLQRCFSAEEVALAQTIANQVAIAIENARLFEEERNSRRLADTLREIAQALNSTLSLDDVLALILAESEKVIAFDSSSIMLLEGKDLIIRALKGFADPGSVLKARLDLDTALLNREVVESKRPLIVGSVHEDERWLKAMRASGLEPELYATCSWMGVPLNVKGRVIGMLTTDRREAHFYSERDAQVALIFANQAAIAIENARLFEATSQYVAELEAVHQASLHLTARLELQPVLEAILEHALQLVSADDAHVFLYDGERLTFGAAMWAGGRQQEPYAEPRSHGLTYTVARSGERVVIPDMKNHPLFQDGRWDEWDGAIVGIPLHIGDLVQGVMNVAFEKPHSFSEDDLRTLELLADQAAIAIKNARLFEEAQRRWQEAETLYRAAQALATTIDLHQVFECILSELQQVVPYDSASVQLLRGKRLEIIGGHGFPNLDELLGITFDLSESNPNREVMSQRAPFIVDDASAAYPEFRKEPHAAAGVRAYLGVPLLFGDRLIGMIALGKREPGFYTPEHARLASAFAAQAAIAIENAHLYEETKQRAEEMTALHETTLDITAQLEMPRLLNAVIARASDLLGATGGLIHLYDPARERLTAVTSHNLEQDYAGLTLKVGEGVAGRVFQTGEPLIIDDHCAWAGKSSQVADAAARSMIGVPLKWQGRVIGILDIMDNVRVGAFDEQHLRLLMPFANQAAIAIQNARLFEEARQRTRQWEALTEVGRTIASILNLDDVLQLILERLEQVIPYDTVSLWLREGEVMRIQAVRGFEASEAHLDLATTLQDDALSKEMVSTRQPLILADAQRDERFHGLVGTEWVRSWLGVPLLSKGEVIGLVTLNKREPGLYTAETAELALAFGQQAALAIENARLYAVQRQRAAQLESLNVIAATISQVLDLDEVLNLIVCQAAELMGAETMAIPLLSEDGTHLTYAAVHGRLAADLFGLVKPLRDTGICTWVLRNKQRFYSDDLAADEREGKEMKEALGLRTVISVPMVFKGEAIGAITAINRRDGGLFTRADLDECLQPLANHAAIAIGNARLFDETKRRAEEMTALYHTSLEIGAPTELPDLLWTLCDRAAKLLDVNKGGLYLYDEARKELELVLSYKLERDFTGTRFKLGEGVAGRIAQTGQSLIVNDYSRWEGRAPVYGEEPFAAVIGVPLRWQERIIGAITLSKETKQRTFTPGDERLLALFAQQAAAVIENARLYEEARRHVEELTALHTIDIAIASTLNLDKVLQRVYEQVGALMDDVAFHIALYDEERDELYVPIIVDQGERLPPQTLKVEEASGLTGWVVRTREPLWIGDMEVERDMLPVKAIALGISTRSLMVLPLVVRDKVVGVISAQSYEPYVFDEGYQRLFAGIASQVAIAVENARLFEETNRRLAETRLLQEVMQAAASTLDFDEVLRHTVELVRSELQLDVFGFLLVDEEAGVARLHPTFLGIPDEATGFSTPLGEGITGWVAQTGQPLLVPDVSEEPRYQGVIPGVRSEVCVPLKIGDKVIGVIDVESKELDAFSGDDVRFFSTLAAQLGVVLDNARLYKKATQRLAEAMLTQEVILAIASTLDFDLVLERAVKALHRALKIDRLGFLLPGERDDVLSPHPSLVGFTGEDFQIPIESSLTGRAYRTGQPVLMRDAEQESAQSPDIRSALAVPVRVGGRIVAVFHAESLQQGAFGEDELRLFTTIAGQLGVALEKARLYQRLEAQAAKLSRAYEELQEINRLRTELVQNVGHELRTPLGLVKGYVELLLGGDLGDLLGAQRDALEVVRARTDTLERLIHNLTVLQAVPRNALTLIPVSVGEALRHALAEFRPIAERADVVFQDELPAELPLVLGDQKRLKLAFDHLMDNAIKFSPDGGTVTVRAWADQEMVYVSIADEGIGISFEHQDRIFERFYQVNGSTSRRFGGMGVGLALVWEIVEVHYGTVAVESEPGKGSIFIVALPRAEK